MRLRKIVLIALLAIETLCSSIYFLGYTESGLRFCLSMFDKWQPGALRIKHSSGNLMSGFQLENLSYHHQNQNITVSHLELEWQPRALFHKKILIKKLVVEDANLNLPVSNGTNQPLALPSFITIKEFIFKKTAIQYGHARLTVNGSLTDKWNTIWQLTIPDIHEFLPNYNGSLSASGNIAGPMLHPIVDVSILADRFKGPDIFVNKIQSHINIHLESNAHSKISLSSDEILWKNNSLKKFKLSGDGILLQPSQFLFNWKGSLEDKYLFEGQFSFPQFVRFMNLQQPVVGQLHFKTTDLSFLTHWISYIKNPQGLLTGNIKVNRTLENPLFSGEILLRNGRTWLTNPGVQLEKINLEFFSESYPQLKYQGNFQLGDGSGKIQGAYDFSKQNDPIGLHLQGQRLQILKSREYDVTASPDLTVDIFNDRIRIVGDVFIPSAKIALNTFDNTVTLPDEVTFVDQENVTTASSFPVEMKINLNLSHKIQFAYKDFEAMLGGKLHINQNFNGPMTATGELFTLKGTYTTYGNVLKIQEGHLIFTGGSLFNPGINVLASKEIKTKQLAESNKWDNQPFTPNYVDNQTITVGVQLVGTIDNYRMALYSNPAGLSQKEILSYLALGHAAGGGNALLNAATAFNLGGSSKVGKLTKKLQQKLGLSELNVAATDVFDPASGKVSSMPTLMVGKEITPDLYALYSKSLQDSSQTLNLRYQLSKRFSIQSETSTLGNGADLLYSIERD